MNVLVLNSGSSSLKFQIIATDLDRIKQHQDQRLCKGEVERIGGEAIITFQAGQDAKRKFTAPLRDIPAALDYLVRFIASDKSGVSAIKSSADINAVGHRVVHGGELFTESALINDQVLHGIEDCIDLAPLHNPGNLQGIQAARELFGKDTPQVAVFDTSFHHSIPDCAYLYAIPYHLYRRYQHAALRIPWHLASLCRVSLSRAAGTDPRADQHHHLSPGKWLLRGRYQRRQVRRYFDGHDAAGRTGDGNALGRSRSFHCEPHRQQGRYVAVGGRDSAEHPVRTCWEFPD